MMHGPTNKKHICIFVDGTWHNLDGVVTRLWGGRFGVWIPAGKRNFLISRMSRPTLGPTQLPVPWVLWAVTAGVKRPDCTDRQWSASSAKVQHAWRKKSSPPVCVRGLYMDEFSYRFYNLRCFWNVVSAAETALPRILMASNDDEEGWVLKIWKFAYSKALSGVHAKHNSN